MLYILHLYYEESHYFNDTQLWNIKNNWTKICILTKWGDQGHDDGLEWDGDDADDNDHDCDDDAENDDNDGDDD